MRAGMCSLNLLFVLAVFGELFGFSTATNRFAPLTMNFYRRSCPKAEKIVEEITWNRTAADPALAPALLRLHYHDCFVRGCDASILLDRNGTEPSEKEARPNLTLQGFEVIDEIKAKLQQYCPDKVSCADVLALAARDAVSFQFQKSMWDVPTGRKDGVVTLSSDVNNNLPSPFANFTTLKDLFARKRLNVRDLVALSGAHTIGVAHCGAFSRRLFNFTGNNDADPNLNSTYADTLRQQCPIPPSPTKTVEMDPLSSSSFDSNYFFALGNKQGLFVSDAALLTDPVSVRTVAEFRSQSKFFGQFAESMRKMGLIDVLVGGDGQIRKRCRFVN